MPSFSAELHGLINDRTIPLSIVRGCLGYAHYVGKLGCILIYILKREVCPTVAYALDAQDADGGDGAAQRRHDPATSSLPHFNVAARRRVLCGTIRRLAASQYARPVLYCSDDRCLCPSVPATVI